MNDECLQKQLSRFEGQFGNFSLKANLQENNSLLLTFINSNTFEYFETILDRKSIKSQPSFCNIFEQPADIIDFLHAHFNQVIIQDGSITFQVKLGKYNTKQIYIQVPKKDISPSILLSLRLARMKEEFQTDLSKMSKQKDQIIQKLEERVKDNQRKIGMLQGQLTEATRSIASIVEQCKSYRPAFEKRQQEEKPSKKKEEGRPQYGRKQQVPKDSPIKKEQSKPLGTKDTNPHRDHFKSALEGKYLNIARCTTDGFYSFAYPQEISKGQCIRYMIKVKKLTKQYCCVGFGTEKALGFAKASQPEAIFYLFNGNVFECGQARTVDSKCDEGDLMKVECDLINDRITWRKRYGRIAQVNIPQSFKGKTLYLMILLNFKGDEVGVLVDE